MNDQANTSSQEQPPATPLPPQEAPKEGAAERLAAFEDKIFGKAVPRINGKVERGHGSPFAMLKPPQREIHAALEALIMTESGLAATRNSLLKAEEAHVAAEKRAADAEAAVPVEAE